MSRFGDGDYDNYFPNSGDLWWANVERALSGKPGQTALRELEQALLDLPEKRLISGHLALNGQVCTVGALALHRRVSAGETREAVLELLERAIPTDCAHCYHPEDDHGEDGCSGCADIRRWHAEAGREYTRSCPGFEPSEYPNCDGELITTEQGVAVGLTFVLAWRLAYLNDEDFADATPEDRYERVLEWVRRAILEPVPA
jgi:hypothetical protein